MTQSKSLGKLNNMVASISEIVGKSSPKHVIESVIKSACQLLVCDRASVFVHDQSTDQLVLGVSLGLVGGIISLPKDKGVVGYSFTRNETVNIRSAYDDERFNKQIDLETGYKTKSILAMPIIEPNSSRVIGVLQAINKVEGKYFTVEDELIASRFSAIVAKVIENTMQETAKMQILMDFNNIHQVAPL